MKVSNRKCIRRLSWKSLGAARTRNAVAVLAIALTTILFTSLFTIAASINYSFEQQNFRQAGGDGHGTVKDVTQEQVEQLRTDPLIESSGARLMLGMPTDPPFNKSHVEVSYLEPQWATHYFCDPVEGALPEEGTDQAATDTRVLSLLGIEPEIGAKFTLPFYLDVNTGSPVLVERTFTLSGWWEYDSAVVASHVLVPLSAAREIEAQSAGGEGTMTGVWALDVMLKSGASHIREDMLQILENHGYQNDRPGEDNYLKIGVNWGYTGAQLSNSMDPTTLIAIVVLLLLIIFTGYLIIYNIFQISVTNDIRFYGLLKTIGTTGRQIRRMIRQQALLLCGAGIPLGLVLGFFIGNKLTPVIMEQLSYKNVFVSFNPWIFIGAALFSLVTVAISCARPGRMAARVSPVEAVRYTEGSGKAGRGKKTARGKVSLAAMAWANLGRSRGKTLVTVLSLTLAVVLTALTFTFTSGFDMDKYLASNVVSDFIVSDASYFQVGGDLFNAQHALPQEVIDDVEDQGGITGGGRIYGKSFDALEFVTEDWFRTNWGAWNPQETLDWMVNDAEKTADGRIADRNQLYGMEEFPLSKVGLLEGDLAPLSDPTQNAIAAVVLTDDYGEPRFGSNWARLGDTVTVRYVEETEYYYTDTGEIIPELSDQVTQGDRGWSSRSKVYRDVEYTVCAVVNIPHSIGYRYYGADEFILGAEQFIQDSGTSDVMTYIFDTTDEGNAPMENFLQDYTENVQTAYDYESAESYKAEFEGFRDMFMTMGAALSAVIGLVGVLNFVNAVLTGILTRKREFAVLQSIGMTGRQLKTMLVYEGLYYTMLSMAASLLLTVAIGPLVGGAVGEILWFFTYKLTLTPILILLPVFLLLGCVVPLLTYRTAARRTIVERLRESE